MLVGEAKAAARRWVAEEGTRVPGVRGAFFHGSVTWLPDGAELAPDSDLDVVLVVEGPPPPKPGKVVSRGALLDVTYLPADELRSPEQILGVSHLAGSLRTTETVLFDPTGDLRRLATAVAREYAARRWVLRRCAHAEGKLLGYLGALDPAAPFHDGVTSWVFAAGLTTHVLLAAGLRNPTVRTRYAAARRLLEDHGRPAFFEDLLDLLGCVRWDRARAEGHLAALAPAFDAAAAVVRSPFPFASDLSPRARPIAIGGSRALIGRGEHREAVFWLVVTASRCQAVFALDGTPELRARFAPAYRALLADLGIASSADLPARGEAIRAFLPRLRAETEAVMAANPAIKDDRPPAA